MKRVLLIDNYDSFTHNLAQALGKLGAEVLVVRNDAIDLDSVRNLAPTHIVLSPGPGHPENPRDIGVCADIIKHALGDVPLLGVCLGHQALAQYLGGRVIRAPQIVHGKMHRIRHNNSRLFAGLEQDIEVMRYHSLVAERASLPPVLRITAETADGLIMAVEHVSLPVFGLQFHPESIGTPDGEAMLARFLEVV
jgi:anthranilate synthase component 2